MLGLVSPSRRAVWIRQLEAEDGLEAENNFVDPEEDGVSLRTRLTRAVDSKRSTGDDDTHQWR